MNRISAAEHYAIEDDSHSWRLLSFNELGQETQALGARPGAPLSYTSEFAATRRLPSTLTLPVEYVAQVVVGWSSHDDAWHLGLVLVPDLAGVRGSRWCELAYWPDPDPAVFAELAKHAGRGLSRVINRPLNIISPERRATQEPVAPPLPPLPLQLGIWQLNHDEQGVLNLERSGRWIRERYGRLLWYGLWLIIYLGLSIATLNSDLALPNSGTLLPEPELLPYLGLGIAAIIVLLMIRTTREILTQPDRIVFDGAKGSVIALRGTSQRWYKNGNDLDSVYVTQIVNRKSDDNTLYEAALSLHLQDGSFLKLAHNEKQEDLNTVEGNSEDADRRREAVVALDRFAIATDWQAAAATISETLGKLPCWYDRRTR